MDPDLTTLLPADRKAVLEIARESGRPVTEVVAELIHAALAAQLQSGLASPTEQSDPAYEPAKTELGQKLRALTRKHLEEDGKLFSIEEINAELAEGRGSAAE